MTSTNAPQVLLPGQAHRRCSCRGSTPLPPGPVDLIGVYVMHHAVRRDFTGFQTATDVADLADHIRWQALDRRWQIFAAAPVDSPR